MMAADLPMQDVRAQYAELKATLSTFQASVGDCLERAEAEFLQAYRAHMVEVHRELQQLRAQLGSAEASLRDDDGVRELEASGAWYRGEAAQQAAAHAKSWKIGCSRLNRHIFSGTFGSKSGCIEPETPLLGQKKSVDRNR